MKKALVIALREVKSYLQDKGDLAFSLLLPVVTFALIYGAFGGQSLFHGTAYIVNEDNGDLFTDPYRRALRCNKSLDVQAAERLGR